MQDAHTLGMKVVLDVCPSLLGLLWLSQLSSKPKSLCGRTWRQVNHACGRGLKYLGRTSGVDGVNFCVKSTEATYWSSPRGGAMQEYGRGRLGFGDTLPAFLRHQSFFVRCGPAKLYRPGGKDFTRLPPENASSIEGGLWLGALLSSKQRLPPTAPRLFPEIFQDPTLFSHRSRHRMTISSSTP